MADDTVNVSVGATIGNLVSVMKEGATGVQAAMNIIKNSAAAAGGVVQGALDGIRDHMRRTEQQADQTANSMNGSFGKVGGFLTGVLGPILAAFSLERAISSVLAFADAAESLQNTAQITGMTTNALARLHAVATPMGLAADSVDTGLKKLAKTLVDAQRGGEETGAAFEALGIKGAALKNMSLEQALAAISDKFATTEDGAEKTAIATALLGRRGADLIPMLNQGTDAMNAQADAADAMGAVMNDKAVAAGAALDEAWDKLTMQGTGLKNLFNQALAPALQFIAECLTDGMDAGLGFGEVFKGVATIVIGAVAVIKTAWEAVKAIVGSIVVSIASIIDAIAKAAQMDWSGAKAALQTGDEMIRENLMGMLNNQQQIATKFKESMNNMWGDGMGKPPAEGEAEGPKGQLKLADKGAAGAASAAAKAEAAAAKQAARDEFEYKMQLLQNEMTELAKGSAEKIRIAQQQTALVAAQFGEESKEYARAKGNEVKIAEEVANEKRRIADTALAAARDQAALEIALERGKADALVAMGDMTNVQRVAFQQATEEQIYAMQLSYLQQRLALMASEPQEVERINAEIIKLKGEHQLQMQTMDLQNFEANKAQWDSYFQVINDGLANSFQQMIFQGQTWQQSLGNIIQQVTAVFIQNMVKMMTSYLSTEAAKTSATVAGNAIRTASDAAAAKQSIAATAGAAIKNIMTKAVEVFANVYNAIAGIPYVGPFLAPVMAVAAGATVVGLVGKVASAEGGWDRVPYDGAQAILHKEEMVLPGPLAEGIRGMVESGQRGGPQVTVQAMDRRDVQRYFDDNADVYMRSLVLAQANNPGGI